MKTFHMHFAGTGYEIKELLFPAVEALPDNIFRTPRYGLSPGEHFIGPRDLEARVNKEKSNIVEIFPTKGTVVIGFKIPDKSKDTDLNPNGYVQFRYSDYTYRLYRAYKENT